MINHEKESPQQKPKLDITLHNDDLAWFNKIRSRDLKEDIFKNILIPCAEANLNWDLDDKIDLANGYRRTVNNRRSEA